MHGAAHVRDADLISVDASVRGESVLCIDVDEIDAYYETLKDRGAKITSDLETKPWGMGGFTVEDLNGNQLHMGVKPISEAPEFDSDSQRQDLGTPGYPAR